MEDIEDTTNITGLASLLNPSHTDDALDLEKIERSIIGTVGVRVVKESDPALEYRNAIKELSLDTGINLDDDSDLIPPPEPIHSTPHSSHRSSQPSQPSQPSQQKSVSFRDSVREPMREQIREPVQSQYQDHYLTDEAPSTSGYEMEEGLYDDEELDNMEFLSDISADGHTRRPQYSVGYVPRTTPNVTPYQHRFGNAVPRHEHLDDVLKTYTGNYSDVNLEREHEEDLKATLLEDIDELKSELSTDGVDLSRIPDADQDTDLEKVKKIHKILRMKYDRKRCNSLGSEIILAGAQGLGYICDGKRRFGPFRPNLVGWHNTVRAKLRRMHYETSTIVSGIMQEYNVGPLTRVLMELVPSGILYSHMANEQKDEKTYSPGQMSAAYDELRQFE